MIELIRAVADPGFPQGEGANSPNFPKNCMKLKEFGLLGGACPSHPLRSATAEGFVGN